MTSIEGELEHVWLVVDPDLDGRLKAEAHSSGERPADLFRGYVIGGLLAEQAGVRPTRPTPAEKLRLVSVSLFVPSLVEAELQHRSLTNRVSKSDLYRAYLRLGIEVGRPLEHAALAIRMRSRPIQWWT